ncbi:major facilitator superfamily domain-containing protein [Mycena sanguinolenta]|nr:major facilitator superfamily domain-containing protein [Mycena sanguinolenta]
MPDSTLKEDSNLADRKRPGALRFWTIFLTLGLALGLSPLELTSVSTVLPSIVNELHGANFIWISAAYSLGSTAIVPMSGNLAAAYGRKPCSLLSIALFALGSVLCAAARNIPWLIAGRALQGMGGGGVVSFTNIIVSDLVPLKDRGWIGAVLNFIWAHLSMV